MAAAPITIVTGFLGSGKTTLVNALLRDPDFAGTAVLINEFGDVQIDHDLVARFSGELVTTTTGCICCTASSDIKQSLFELWQKRQNGEVPPFERVVVESTGLMDPVPVVNALLAVPSDSVQDQTVGAHFALAQVVTLFDIINGAYTLDTYPEAMKQVALADVVVLTKTDLAHDPVTRRDIDRDRDRIAALNPSARIWDRHADWLRVKARLLSDGTYDLRDKGEDANAWLQAEQIEAAHHHGHDHGHGHDHEHGHDHDHLDRNRHGDDIRSHVIYVDEPISRLVFFMFLESLKLNAGTDLLRIKGLFALANDPDHPIVVHGVQHLIHPIDRLEAWPSDDRRTRIVLIGRNLDIDAFKEVLRASDRSSEPQDQRGHA